MFHGLPLNRNLKNQPWSTVLLEPSLTSEHPFQKYIATKTSKQLWRTWDQDRYCRIVMDGKANQKSYSSLQFVGALPVVTRNMMQLSCLKTCVQFFAFTRSPFEPVHTFVLIISLWHTFEDARSQIVTVLNHLWNSSVKTMAVPKGQGLLCIIRQADKSSRKPCNSQCSADILKKWRVILCTSNIVVLCWF